MGDVTMVVGDVYMCEEGGEGVKQIIRATNEESHAIWALLNQ